MHRIQFAVADEGRVDEMDAHRAFLWTTDASQERAVAAIPRDVRIRAELLRRRADHLHERAVVVVVHVGAGGGCAGWSRKDEQNGACTDGAQGEVVNRRHDRSCLQSQC